MSEGRRFGRHIKSLRRARGMTQEQLAAHAGLSADTIRRLEHGSFSPSRDTLVKLCDGFDLMMSTLFLGYEVGERDRARELVDLVLTRSDAELIMLTTVVRTLCEQLGQLKVADDC